MTEEQIQAQLDNLPRLDTWELGLLLNALRASTKVYIRWWIELVHTELGKRQLLLPWE